MKNFFVGLLVGGVALLFGGWYVIVSFMRYLWWCICGSVGYFVDLFS